MLYVIMAMRYAMLEIRDLEVILVCLIVCVKRQQVDFISFALKESCHFGSGSY